MRATEGKGQMLSQTEPLTPAFRHDDSFLTLAQTSVESRFDAQYQKTYAFPGDFIDQIHASFKKNIAPNGMIASVIEGWLLPQDAQKLYECAYFCRGDILELGTYRGLSASVMSAASLNAGLDNVIVSVDLDAEAIARARANLQGAPGAERCHLFVDEAGAAVRNLAAAKRSFAFAFIDHSHRYDHVYDVCRSLHRVLDPGALALLHDFNDPRNAAPAAPDYGVYQGALDGLDPRRFEFWGIYGCCGLFRRIGPF